jgi:hypothetical protein
MKLETAMLVEALDSSQYSTRLITESRSFTSVKMFHIGMQLQG